MIGNCVSVVAIIPPSFAVGVPASTISYSHNPGTEFPVGTTTVTATATNAAGTSTCTFDVVVVDTEVPEISCPADIVVSNDPRACGAVVNFANLTVTDNCIETGSQTYSYTGGAQTFTVPDGVTLYQILKY